MKNTLSDLNNYMFERLERLNDDELSEEQLKKEIEKSKAMVNVGRVIIDNANVILKANEIALEYNQDPNKLLIGD